MITKHIVHQLWVTVVCVLVLCACTAKLQDHPRNELTVPTNTSSPKGAIIRLYTSLDQTYAPNSSINLSTGRITSPDDGDIQFTLSRGGGGVYFYALQPINGAKSNSVGNTNPGFDGCNQVASKLTTGAIPEILLGNFICITTEQGLLVQMEIQDMNLNEGWIEINYEVRKD